MEDPLVTTHARFAQWAEKASAAAGSPLAFLLAAASVALWALTGPVFSFSETWQIVINTATTIVTFLLVFLIQNSQNRETRAVQLKLDELIRATEGAHNTMLNLERLTDEELQVLCGQYEKLAHTAREQLRRGLSDQDAPDVPPDLNTGADSVHPADKAADGA